jgi:hypothetical protein
MSYENWSTSPVLTIDGLFPTASEVRTIQRPRSSVRILKLPLGLDDLAFLAPAADAIEVLDVLDPNCRDVRLIETMTSLRRVGLNVDERYPVDLARVTRLESYSGPWKRMESVIDCLNLSDLRLTSPDVGKLSAIKSSLARLDIYSVPTPQAVPVISPAKTTLNELLIYGARDFDLKPIIEYQGLTQLTLSSCRSLHNLTALLDLPVLKNVFLERCPDLDGWEDLARLEGVQVKVIDRNPFDLHFREEVRDGGKWPFPLGRAYIGAPRGIPTARSLYLLHPGRPETLVPFDQVLDELSRNDMEPAWLTLARDIQLEILDSLWNRCLDAAIDSGADRVVRSVAPYGDDDVRIDLLSPQIISALRRDILELSYLKVMRGSEMILEVGDSIEEGILIRSSGSPHI